MPNAPAGWYDDPAAPGRARYWNGAAWLAPGAGPTVAAPGFAPQSPGFAPQPTGFAPQPTTPQYRPTDAVDSRPVPQEDAVTWDVVGTPRAPDSAGASRAPQTPWQNSAPQGYGRAGDPGAYAPSLYGSQPPLPPYGSSASGRKGGSGWTKVAAVVTFVVVGVGVWWGFGQVFGPDHSDDRRSDDIVAGSATPSATAPPSVEPGAASQTAIGSDDSGQLLSPSGLFTFLIDPTWNYDSASVESAEIAPGETPIGAWWTADPYTTPDALWVAISEYSRPGITRADAHQEAVDAFVAEAEVLSVETDSFVENTGTEGVTTEVKARVNGTDQRCEVITIGSDGHFLMLFIVGSDTDTTRANAEAIRFFIAPTGD